MARQVRIEFPGAIYHVMARGDRREAIVRDDEDRQMFLRTLGEACERSGFRVHAYVLMSNHYHLLIETEQANLSRGMGWLQNAFTRRINTRHRLWGHVFGGRYKAILVEPGNYLWAMLDYIHLNPTRAGMVRERDGLESYSWSSLTHYIATPKSRPKWMEPATGLQMCGCADTAEGRREFLRMLERRVDWKAPSKAGTSFPGGDDEPELAVYSALRRGWLFGSQSFREKLLRLVAKKAREPARQKKDGYHGGADRDYAEKRALQLLQAGLKYFNVGLAELQKARKNDPRKMRIAELIQAQTTMRLDWISEQLNMGTRAGCCRMIKEARAALAKNRPQRREREEIENINIK